MSTINNKIPLINDSFDPNALLLIIKKNLLLFVLFLIIMLGGVFLYLRYTPPTYEAVSVLQINEDEATQNSLLSIENVYGNTSISNLIEQLRSKEFKKRVVSKLPLGVTCYNKGTFKEEELYARSPFFIEVKELNPEMVNVPVFIDFLDETKFVLSYLVHGRSFTDTLKTNTWQSVSGCVLYFNISNYMQILEFKKNLKKNRYFFRLLDENSAIQFHMASLMISILNDKAKTIEIKYSGKNAQKASDIVNAVSESFIEFNLEKKTAKAESVLDFIDQQLKIVYVELDKTEQSIRYFRQKYNIKEPASKVSALVDFQDDDSNADAEKKIQILEQQFETLSKISDNISVADKMNTAELLSFLSDSKSESMIINFLNAINQLQIEKEKLLVNVTENNRKIKSVDSQIENQKKLLSDFINLSNESIAKEQDELRKKLELKDSLSRRSILQYDEIEYAKLLRIYNVHQGFYNDLLSKKAEFMISKAANVTQNLILEKSQVPQTPIAPMKVNIILISVFLFLLISISTVVIKYLLHNEITSANDIVRFTSIPVTGVIPFTKKASGNFRFFVENKPNSIFTESFRTLRSNLDFIAQSQTSKVISVSSTISGEGKTFIAVNLAGVYSFSGKKVVVIDMDLRKPKIHLSFDISNEKGMSTLLINRDELKDCIYSTSYENVFVIPAGPLPPNPSELANSEKYTEIISSLKEQFDIIIIDTPPIGIVSDALYSYMRSDYPLYITKANYSKKNFLYNINHLKDQKNINTISIVINGTNIKSNKYGYSNYSYGYEQYQGYGYYTKEEEVEKESLVNKIKNYITNKKNG
ncbi:MAG: polysaccharide biosynthesis tyrosine autokinase [Bacteroidales bacterium]|nr:polysaccharide biosynthesis tyrosine autokinase [Bacteroidales bacterium]